MDSALREDALAVNRTATGRVGSGGPASPEAAPTYRASLVAPAPAFARSELRSHRAIPINSRGTYGDSMIRLLLLVEGPTGLQVEVLTLAQGAFETPLEAELWVFSGEGGEAPLPLWTGGQRIVKRDDVEAVSAWQEGDSL